MLRIKIHDKLKPILRIRHRTGRLILYDIEKNGEKVSMLFLKIGAAVLFSHFVEGISGFGCMILALPVVSALLGMKAAVPMLVILYTLILY